MLPIGKWIKVYECFVTAARHWLPNITRTMLFACLILHFHRYKNENSRSSQAAANMKRILEYVSDVRMRYKLANDLNFRDLGASIVDGDGGAFL